MEIYRKLQEAREIIKKSPLKKNGYNSYSKYAYYTPEQVEMLVYDACQKIGLLTKFDLVRDQFGLTGILSIFELSNEKDFIPTVLEFKMATDIPQITATNETQRLGGTMTFTERYLKMTAFSIMDNTLDFDTPKEHKDEPKEAKKEPEKWLNIYTDKTNKELTKEFTACHTAIHGGEYKVSDIRKKYKVSKEVEAALNNEFFIEQLNI